MTKKTQPAAAPDAPVADLDDVTPEEAGERPPLPARFSTGGATADERAAWIAENGG